MRKVILFVALATVLFAKESLNVYTYSSFVSDWGPGPKIKQSFEKECNCTLNFIGLDDSASILSRLKLEGKHTKADVILGLDTNTLSEAKSTGLIAKHERDLSTLMLPIKWTDEYFVPFDYGYFAFIYDSSKTKNLPKSFEQFLNDNRKIIYQDPRTSSVGLGLLLWINKLYGKNANTSWDKISKKTLSVTKGWSEAYNMFLKGEAPFVLSYTTSPAYHLIAEKKPQYKALKFDEGHYMQIEVVAKVKNSKHDKLADEFMKFVLSENFQKHIPTGNWMYPVIDVKLPDDFSKLEKVKGLSFDADDVSKFRKTWIKQWRTSATK